MQTRAERLARGWLVGAFATGVAAVSHTIAGGYRPDALGLTAALVFSGMLGTLAIGRRPSLPRLSIAVAGSQLGFHLLFAILRIAPPQAETVPQPERLAAMTGMHMGQAAVAAPAGLSHMDHLLDPGMWVGHAIAAVLTILFLRRAESAVWDMLRRLVVRMLRIAPLAPAIAPPPTSAARTRVLRAGRHVVALPQRGPPLLASH